MTDDLRTLIERLRDLDDMSRNERREVADALEKVTTELRLLKTERSEDMLHKNFVIASIKSERDTLRAELLDQIEQLKRERDTAHQALRITIDDLNQLRGAIDRGDYAPGGFAHDLLRRAR